MSKIGSKGDSGGEEADSYDAPSEPTVYRADAVRLPRPEGERQDGFVYTITGPTIDGVTHDFTLSTDDMVEKTWYGGLPVAPPVFGRPAGPFSHSTVVDQYLPPRHG